MAKIIREEMPYDGLHSKRTLTMANELIVYEQRVCIACESFFCLQIKRNGSDVAYEVFKSLLRTGSFELKLRGGDAWEILVPEKNMPIFMEALERLEPTKLSSNDRAIRKCKSLSNGLKCVDVGLVNDQNFVVLGNIFHSVFISSETGDVANQVYEIFKKDNRFTIKLSSIMSWYVEIPAEQVEDFMAAVEKLDVSKLKPGVTH